MSFTDLNRGELREIALEKLHEVSTSEAFSTAYLDNLFNEAYMDVFNQPNKATFLTEGKVSFMTIIDQELDGAVDVGDLTIVLDDSSELPNTGRILIDNEFIDYTANNTGTNTLTVPALTQDHIDGATVRYCRPLPADIDTEQAYALSLDGVPYYYCEYTSFLDVFQSHPLEYTIFQGFIIFPEGNASRHALFTYKKLQQPIEPDDDTADDETYELIPNAYRVHLLVNYVIGVGLNRDGQDGWQQYWNPDGFNGKGSGLYYKNLRAFYAKYGRRINGQRKPYRTIYD